MAYLAWPSSAASDFGVARPTRRRARLYFFRAFSAPTGHMWQWAQSWPFWHPTGFQNQAQGWHSPLPWNADPWLGALGASSRPGGGDIGELEGCDGGDDTGSEESSCSEWAACSEPTAIPESEQGPVVDSWSEQALVEAFRSKAPGNPASVPCSARAGITAAAASCFGPAAVFGVERPRRMMICLTFFLALISPTGQRWQCSQFCPFWQPCGLQNHGHGRHFPVMCSADPALGSLWAGSSPGGNCSPGSASPCVPGRAKLLLVLPPWFHRALSPEDGVSSPCGNLAGSSTFWGVSGVPAYAAAPNRSR
mmetsp:Transcript_87449/g.247972  ORF Transcript_87449/g.247972 Transcript_87449/m.247972 type:complete len:308 (+) Transcript_87449:379-1302(+)